MESQRREYIIPSLNRGEQEKLVVKYFEQISVEDLYQHLLAGYCYALANGRPSNLPEVPRDVRDALVVQRLSI